MSAVTVQEIVEAFRDVVNSLPIRGYKVEKKYFNELADQIKQHGIAPPAVDANGCSTHPKAKHGFARQASHSEGEYVCDCAGFDPYDAGYQDGIRAAWDADGALLPDGWVLVENKPIGYCNLNEVKRYHEREQSALLWGRNYPECDAVVYAAPELKP